MLLMNLLASCFLRMWPRLTHQQSGGSRWQIKLGHPNQRSDAIRSALGTAAFSGCSMHEAGCAKGGRRKRRKSNKQRHKIEAWSRSQPSQAAEGQDREKKSEKQQQRENNLIKCREFRT